MVHTSTVSKLRTALAGAADGVALFLRGLEIKRLDRPSDIIFIAPQYFWARPTTEQQARQLGLKREFDVWANQLRIMFKNAPREMIYKLDQGERAFRKWIELKENWSLSPDRAENEVAFKKDVKALEGLLDILEANAKCTLIVVPDTNAIVEEPDPTKYRTAVCGDEFTFLLLPTVLGELDLLKNQHKNPDFREKVKKAITRIKGWRVQGGLSKGVTVDQTITVKSIANEPDMASTLPWLKADVRDDRIIASLLELQSLHPNAKVVLVTGDVNLLNKADSAMIDYAEL
jgi:hypothetical protein